MAEWPANGVTDWNTKMLAYLAVGHDTDGTHGKTQMLTDLGYSPTAYAGGETVTLPNGLIIKFGWANDTATTTTVTFGGVGTEDPFPNGIVAAFVTGKEDATTSFVFIDNAGGISVDNIVVRRTADLAGGFYWLAIGH